MKAISIIKKFMFFLLLGITAGSGNAFAYELGHVWEFNQNSYNFGRVADSNSLINAGQANADWEKKQYTVEYEQLDDKGNARTITDYNVWHCFIKHRIENNVIQGGTNSNLNSWNIFNGLLENFTFNANDRSFGFCNEDEVTGQGKDCQRRYVVLKRGASFTISNINAGDRIVILMGTDQSTAKLKITNAKDALGNLITQDQEYVLGGSTWFNKGWWSGEYHFIATSNTMTFTVNGGGGNFDFLKLYRVKWFKATTNDERTNGFNPTMNEVVCNDNHKGQTFYHSYKEATPITGQYELHYRGKGERIKVDQILKSGTLSIDLNKITYNNNDEWGHLKAYYTSVPGEYGIFKIRLVTYNTSHNYVADYAERVCSQTYLNSPQYPCTYDFTDLKKYFDEVKSLEQNLDDPDLAFWKQESNAYSFQMAVHTNSIAGHHAQYVNGGEFHLGNHAFPELRGLGVGAYNWGGYIYNDQLKITNEGIDIDAFTYNDENNMVSNVPFKFHIPDIGGNSEPAAVYVRLKYKNLHNNYCFQYKVGSSDIANMIFVGTENGETVYKTPKITTNDEVVLYLNGCVVKKIGVTKDFKKLNILGYASESRGRVMDYSLTEYFNVEPIKAYQVKAADDCKSVTLTEVTRWPKSTNNGEKLGLVLYNKTGKAYNEEGTNEEDHYAGLFVPDIHDTDMSNSSDNDMVSMVNGGLVSAVSGDYTNYVLTYKPSHADEEGNAEDGTQVVKNVEAFYRVQKSGITAKVNQAYLPLLTSKVKPAEVEAHAKISIIFLNEEEEFKGVATKISTPTSTINNNDVIYTLSGVRVDNPTKSGIYIKNGKKVVIK